MCQLLSISSAGIVLTINYNLTLTPRQQISFSHSPVCRTTIGTVSALWSLSVVVRLAELVCQPSTVLDTEQLTGVIYYCCYIYFFISRDTTCSFHSVDNSSITIISTLRSTSGFSVHRLLCQWSIMLLSLKTWLKVVCVSCNWVCVCVCVYVRVRAQWNVESTIISVRVA